jgi:hypothetical protein
MVGVFGEADPLPSLSLNGGDEKEMETDELLLEKENAFPESEVDDMRRVRDSALQRYVQEVERKQEMLTKMNVRAGNN